jgi:nicotinate phosphoribosyltransferase
MNFESGTSSTALLTDLYQLTMAYGYWRSSQWNRQAIFHLFFRKNPFAGGYAIAAGLEQVVEYLESFHFSQQDIDYIASIPGHDGKPIFVGDFLHYLSDLKLEVDLDAIREGTVVFPQQPLLRIKGPLLQCQLIETALLNIINFQTLVATKASRVMRAAQGDSVLEFGLRRAQGPDGAMSASRAAYVGGCSATSNVLAGKQFGIPVRGTHAHSWVMAFDSEYESFAAYAAAMPNNCVFLVDTYDTIEGVRNAIRVGKEMRAKGQRLVGIRLDSGDLAYLSIEARRLLDEAGFHDASIVASNDLDERLIESLKRQGAKIDVWGVGTKLVTAYDQAALGGVYKLGAIRDDLGEWKPKIKLSEQLIKITTPGILQVRRYFDNHGKAIADVMFDELHRPQEKWLSIDPEDYSQQTTFGNDQNSEELVVPVMRQGNRVATSPSLAELRQRTIEQLKVFPAGILRFDNPHKYPIGLEEGLYQQKLRLALEGRKRKSEKNGQ